MGAGSIVFDMIAFDECFEKKAEHVRRKSIKPNP